jgi:RNA polymerase sigma factor (sigma-70 family)
MKQIQEQNELLDLIRQGDHKAVKQLYRDAFHYCASFVLKNQGNIEIARELFQESLFVLIKKSRDPEFKIQHSIKAFLYTVIRNLWLKQLNQRNKGGLELTIDDPSNHVVLEEMDDFEENRAIEEKHLKLYKGIKLLKEDCRNIISLTFYKKMSDKEIAPQLGYSLEFVRKKRRRCINQLKKIMVA